MAPGLRLSGDAGSPEHDGDGTALGALRFATWCALPFLLLYTTSALWVNVFFYRYAIYSLAPVYALFAAGLLRLPGGRIARCAAVGSVLAMLTYQAVFIPRPIRADYAAATGFVREEAEPNAAVFALKEWNAIAVRYHLNLTRETLHTYYGFDELCEAVSAEASSGTETWVFFYRWDQLDAFEQRMADMGLHAEKHTFAGMPPLYLFAIAPHKA